MDLFIRHYVLRAAEGAVSALRAELGQLSLRIAEIDGVVGVDLMQDEADANRFIFIERWQSVAVYTEGSKLIDKAAFKAVLAHLGAPPEVATLKALGAGGA